MPNPLQQVTAQLINDPLAPENQVTLGLEYSTSDNETTAGLSLYIHYDSQKLTPIGGENGVTDAISSSIYSNTLEEDVFDLDKDAETDYYIELNWAAILGDFPGKPLPATLAKVTFSAPAASFGTDVNLTGISAPTHDFVGTGYTFTSQLQISELSLSNLSDSSIAENSAYTSTTPSITGAIGAVSWSLDGDDASLFSVDQTTGVVSMAAKDFEAPADTGSDNTYAYTLRATDGDGNTTTQAVVVTVTDVQETSTLSLSNLSDSSIAENSAYTSTTPSITGAIGAVSWSLDGDDASLFSVDQTTGVVSMAAKDFEAPADTGSDNTYAYTLRATDGDGNTTTQAVVVTVTDVNDKPTGSVLISGTPTQGETLTADVSGLSDQDGLGTFAYQWKADGTSIPDASGSSFLITQAEVGQTISVVASYTDGGSTEESIESAATDAVEDINDPAEGTLAADGYLLVGKTLSAVDLLTDQDGITPRTYTWQRSTDSSITWSNIIRQDDPTSDGYGVYSITTADAGNQIRVSATYTDQGGFENSIESKPTERVLGAAKIDGEIKPGVANEGSQITRAVADSEASLQWERSTDNTNWEPVRDPNTPSLATDDDWGGSSVRLVIGGQPTDESIALNAINNGSGFLKPLTLDGPLIAGVTITASAPASDPDGTIDEDSIGYQWQRYNPGTQVWDDIADATQSQYTTTDGDVGNALRARVAYTDAQTYTSTLFSNTVKPQEVALPEASGEFDPITGDDILMQAELANGVSFSGQVTSPNTKVTVSFGGQVRSGAIDKSLNTWSYSVKSGDQAYLQAGSNPVTATLTREEFEDGISRVGTTTISRTLEIEEDVELIGSNPNSAADPTQSDGIKQEVKEAAQNADLPNSVKELIGSPNVAVAPLGSGSDFAKGADAPSDSYGAFVLPGDTRVGGVATYAENEGSYSIQNAAGETQTIAKPTSNNLTALSDPIAVSITDLEPGGSIDIDFQLPRSISNNLPADLSLAKYYKLNTTTSSFEDYVDDEGNPYYSYNIEDGTVVLSLRLTDGDKWDQDGLKNGIIVDPGIALKVAAATTPGTPGTPTPGTPGEGNGGETPTSTAPAAAATAPPVIPAVEPTEQSPISSEPTPVPTKSPVLGIQPQTTVTTLQLETPLVIGSLRITQAIVGTAQRDSITGSNADEALAGGGSKDKLTGGLGADAFVFEIPGEFGKRKLDKITDYDSAEGDRIVIAQDAFEGVSKAKIKAVSGKTAVSAIRHRHTIHPAEAGHATDRLFRQRPRGGLGDHRHGDPADGQHRIGQFPRTGQTGSAHLRDATERAGLGT